MNKTMLVAAAALAALATGCASANANGKSGGGSARELTEAAGHGIHLDYTPLVSPQDAVGKADLIVEGTLVEVTDGIQFRYADASVTEREADDYVTFVVAVDRVIDGDAGKVTDSKVYVAVPKGSGTTSQRLSELNPQAKIVAVLDDITTWRPVPEATVVRPAAIPATGPLYHAYRDGLWLQGSADSQMYAIGAEAGELAPAWGGVTEVDGLATALEKAATTG
ncbi:hypothetical protein [Phytohabitans aurantiacus]|uniref:Lipoprotein n=1 Tax=Phytohabitans aurantiacus TaxID=3016789 RepID=A0ABQ5R1H1_9ACTN|nr:hypothetical protein [Phytohabitans aurantiacus]GLI00571.1 hypothetical protein Pa4123_58470 [Phytohabitans aurantiacus]